MAKFGDLIDTGPLASRPAPGTEGRLYRVTEDSIVYRDSGSAWEAYAGAGGGGSGVVDATYLTATAHAGLSAEVVVGATPGGELGGTWAAPTVDATHSGSTHAATQAAAEATAASALSGHTSTTHLALGATGTTASPGDHTHAHTPDAPTTADYLVGSVQGGLANEIVVGTSPGGELGGTWASPTIDASHSGSTHAATQSAAEATAASALTTHAGAVDPHTGYRLESADHTHASTGLQGGQVAHSATSGRTANDHHNQAHTLTGADHTLSGLTVGDVLTATGAASAAFQTPAGGGGGAPTAADYLVGTANATLTNEIVVGTAPGGELGGTWAAPTVDATHSGSAHLALGVGSSQAAAGDHGHGSAYAPPNADYLVGTANVTLTGEIVVGTTPGGELGGTWGTPTVDASHSGSTHAATQAAAESTASAADAAHVAAADPHTGYRLESADHTHATTGLQAGQLAQANTHGTPDTDTAPGSLHHTVGAGANQAAAGNHAHAHSALSGVSADQHHTQAHTLTGADHTLTGLTTGHILTATSATAAAFQAPPAAGAPTGADYLVGTAQGGLSAEIVVGATPGGELGGTWASPTVDATHAGSAHLALGSTGATAAAGNHSHPAGVGITEIVNIVIDGGGSAITTGIKGAIKLPGCTLTAWEIVSVDGTSGSIVVELWSDSYANFPPTVADLVGSTEKPTLSSAIKAQDTSLNSGPGYALTDGNWLMWNVLSVTAVKLVSLALTVVRT